MLVLVLCLVQSFSSMHAGHGITARHPAELDLDRV